MEVDSLMTIASIVESNFEEILFILHVNHGDCLTSCVLLTEVVVVLSSKVIYGC